MIFLCDNFVKISVMKRHSLRALTIHASKIRPLPTSAGAGAWLSVSVHAHTHAHKHTRSFLRACPPTLRLIHTRCTHAWTLSHTRSPSRALRTTARAHTLLHVHTTHPAHAFTCCTTVLHVFTLTVPMTHPPRILHSEPPFHDPSWTPTMHRFWVRAALGQAPCWVLADRHVRHSAQDSKEDAQVDCQACFCDVTASCCPVQCRGPEPCAVGRCSGSGIPARAYHNYVT